MNVSFLMDQIVRQTTILLAQLATTSGTRTPVSHLANQVFLELAEEIERQGVSRKVSADMFGMALRAYQRKVQRLRETDQERDVSLWEAILAHVRSHGRTEESDLEELFVSEAPVLRGVLRDLVRGGVLVKEESRRGVYYVVPDEGMLAIQEESERRSREVLLRAVLYSMGPMTQEQLRTECRLPQEELSRALEFMKEQGLLACQGTGSTALWSCPKLEVLLGESEGWEAAVFDHYQAAVRTIVEKLRDKGLPPRREHTIGGSTYHFDVWPGHPLEEEVASTLQRSRDALSDLRERIDAHNAEASRPEEVHRVTAYVGQVSPRPDDADDD